MHNYPTNFLFTWQIRNTSWIHSWHTHTWSSLVYSTFLLSLLLLSISVPPMGTGGFSSNGSPSCRSLGASRSKMEDSQSASRTWSPLATTSHSCYGNPSGGRPLERCNLECRRLNRPKGGVKYFWNLKIESFLLVWEQLQTVVRFFTPNTYRLPST